MLRNTFVHIPGIGGKTEQRLWKSGITNWDAFFESGPNGLSHHWKTLMKRYLDKSMEQVTTGNPCFFSELLPSTAQWRLFPEFRQSTVYLDIETTGLKASYDNITVIGLYDGKDLFYYVKDENLDVFREDIDKYKVIVTYNGKCFDIPFIREAMGLAMDHAHIDLRFVLASLGFSGGLKGCEKKAGISRGEVTGLDGYDAVLLWNLYEMTGDRKALETLLAYNLQDVVNLETLMIMAYNMKLEDTPFHKTHRLGLPQMPKMPFIGHLDTIDQIKRMKSDTWQHGVT